MKLRPDARSIAVHVISRVLREDAFAAAVLNGALDRYPELDPRERALATELVYGTLRTAGYLERRLAAGAPRGLHKLDEVVRAELWVAAYQLLLLERVPAFAAVSQAVDHVRAVRGPKLAGFCNALLRRLSAAGHGPTTAAHAEEVAIEATAPWLREALERALSAEGARALLLAATPPPIGLRIPPGQDRDGWLKRLRDSVQDATVSPAPPAGAVFELGKVSPLAILARNIGDPERLWAVRSAELAIQEEGAQLVALALGAQPGERVLDACAGRGNKTSLLASLPNVSVDSADLHQSKLDQLGAELARRGVRLGQRFAVDWSVGPGLVPDQYDRVLVDAPCTGTGTLRRRPELALRHRTPENVAQLSQLQCRIALQAASRVRVGGALIYAVCSVLREESEAVVARMLEAKEVRLEPAPFPSPEVARIASDGTTLRILPQIHGTDGYFLASFRRVG